MVGGEQPVNFRILTACPVGDPAAARRLRGRIAGARLIPDCWLGRAGCCGQVLPVPLRSNEMAVQLSPAGFE